MSPREYNTKIRRRCPKCKSPDIRKRVRIYHYEDTKAYRCYVCKHEFDIPFLGPKYQK